MKKYLKLAVVIIGANVVYYVGYVNGMVDLIKVGAQQAIDKVAK